MYRAFTWMAQQHPEMSAQAAIASHRLHLESSDGYTSVLCDEWDISDVIRSKAITAGVSAIAADPSVRQIAVEMQRKTAAEALKRFPGVILEGRDIGSTVLPEADVKFYLTASTRVRAQRRADQVDADVDVIEQEIIRRDHLDSTRAVSPLRQAEDAVVIDASNISIEDVVTAMITAIEAVRE